MPLFNMSKIAGRIFKYDDNDDYDDDDSLDSFLLNLFIHRVNQKKIGNKKLKCS